jgi:hypothetical protein
MQKTISTATQLSAVKSYRDRCIASGNKAWRAKLIADWRRCSVGADLDPVLIEAMNKLGAAWLMDLSSAELDGMVSVKRLGRKRGGKYD